MKIDRLIITRPEPFAGQLHEHLSTLPCETVCCPCMEISALPLPILTDRFDIIIYISRNAVLFGHLLLTHQHARVAAIGLGTKTELENLGITTDIFPKHPPFNSEALLAEPDLLSVTDKKILIVRGGEGRQTLQESLQARGAQVNFANVYERQIPLVHKDNFRDTFKAPEASLAICTSEALLENLCQMAKKAQIDLEALQLCVISSKMAEAAKSHGFKKPAIIAKSARDEDILWTLKTLLT